MENVITGGVFVGLLEAAIKDIRQLRIPCVHAVLLNASSTTRL